MTTSAGKERDETVSSTIIFFPSPSPWSKNQLQGSRRLQLTGDILQDKRPCKNCRRDNPKFGEEHTNNKQAESLPLHSLYTAAASCTHRLSKDRHFTLIGALQPVTGVDLQAEPDDNAQHRWHVILGAHAVLLRRPLHRGKQAERERKRN